MFLVRIQGEQLDRNRVYTDALQGTTATKGVSGTGRKLRSSMG
jgi:hypothetical protein